MVVIVSMAFLFLVYSLFAFSGFGYFCLSVDPFELGMSDLQIGSVLLFLGVTGFLCFVSGLILKLGENIEK